MDWSLGNILILLVVLLLGAVAGWLVMSRRSGATRVTETPAKEPATVAEEPAATTQSQADPVVPEPSDDSSAVESVDRPAEPVAAAPAEPAPVADSVPIVEPAPVVEPTPVVPPAPVVEPAPVPDSAPVVEPALVVADVPADSTPALADPVVPSQAVPEPEPVASVPAQAGPGRVDDFRRIEGIGPKMAAALQSVGISTYEQLGATDEADLRAAVRSAGMRATASLPNWPAKARELAARNQG
ncbi:hypothetical protein [Micromonospora sp. LOL_023]|uniref:hypothetical protein n=1 Tax=Micromonospora sp. LOL_023 TaxID=3345418 RepID=UPI003A83551B